MSSSKVLSVTRPSSVGIDVGSQRVFVGFPDQSVKNYGTTTGELELLVTDLLSVGIQSVAVESTGVYGIVLFDMIRQGGVEAILVNPKYTRNTSGKKTDVLDCQWIQQLHSADLLPGSFVPEASVLEMRSYVRHRDRLIADQAKEVNRMTKALIQMNIRLDTVLSQIHGVSGMKMIEAILAGERDPERLLELCDGRIRKNKATQVIEALKGFYQPHHLFSLEQALDRYKFISEQIQQCDAKIEQHYKRITVQMEPPEQLPKAKPIRHHKPQIDHLQAYNWMLSSGKDLTCIPGITDYTLMRLQGEIGTDLSAFPTVKHFTSWLGLSPGSRQSGKSHKRARRRPQTPAGQIFREIAQSLIQSKHHALGAFGRRLKARKGPRIAIKALARKLPVLYYNALTKGLEFVEKGVEKYERQFQEQQMARLVKMAKKLGHEVVITDKNITDE